MLDTSARVGGEVHANDDKQPPVWAAWRDAPSGWALTDGRTVLTWEQLGGELSRRVWSLRAREWSGAARLAVVGDNSIDTLLVYAACVLAGVGTVSVNHHLKAGEIAHLVRDSGASAIWSDDAHLVTSHAAASEVAGVVVLEAGRWLPSTTVEGTPLWDIPPGEDLTYTSGTTGYPKGVARSRRVSATVGDAVTAMASHYANGLGPHLVAGPLYHGGPWAAVGLLLNANPVVIPRRFDAEEILRLIERFRVASSLMVPTHFVRLLALDGATRQRYDVSSLRVVGQTGAPCPVDVKRAMIGWFGPVLRESYGATESGIVSVIDSHEWRAHPGSVGRAIEPFTAMVVDDDGAELPAGVQGRLFFRDSTGRGIVYHNDPEKSAAAHLAPGIFTLGEIGYVDDEGYIYLTDRATDMVISGGVNVYPAECERVLHGHPSVRDAAVFGVADEEMGERLVGVAVVDDVDMSGELLVAYCREQLAHYKVPRVINLVAELPRSAMGKLDKRRLRETYSSPAQASSG